MLKTRVLSAAVGIVFLVAILLLGRYVLGCAVAAMALVAVYEFYNAVSHAGLKPVRALGYVSCAILPGLVFMQNQVLSIEFIFIYIFIILLVLFLLAVFKHGNYSINDLSVTLLGIAYVVFLFMFIILARNLENGLLLVILILIGAYSTDTFAYFTGMLIGKRKLLPLISPKKTLEGAIGGLAGSVIVTVIYGIYVLNSNVDQYIPVYHFIVLGVLNGIISQIGDWAASSVKRYVNIKDYGTIMPGHGGVLDRFDSVLFVAPVIYFYFTLILK